MSRQMSAVLGVLAVFCGLANAPAQARPAADAGLFAPDPHLQMPRFRSSTREVLLPALVAKRGLQAKDFTVTDDGVPQAAEMVAGPETEPVSLMICVQRGGGAAEELSRIGELGPLLKLFTASGPERAQGKAALVVFDSKPTWVEPFSTDTDTIAHDLRTLPAGDGGAAIQDAVGYAVNLLEEQPGKRRRILLLVSGARDQGSRNFGEPELVERLGTSDVVVVSLMLTASKAAARTWTMGDVDPEPGPNELAPLLTTVEAMRRNLPKTLAGLSGGEYVPLTAAQGWESALAVAARDARRRYVLSIHPTKPTPGLHLIRVKLKGSDRARVTARSIYWAIERGNAEP